MDDRDFTYRHAQIDITGGARLDQLLSANTSQSHTSDDQVIQVVTQLHVTFT